MSRRGVTLVELMVALVITGLVVSIAGAALGGGIASSDRLADVRAHAESMSATRAMLGRALRHALPGARGGDPTFTVARHGTTSGGSSDSLVFLTRGVVEPLGTSAAWRVALWVSTDTLHLAATPTDGTRRRVDASVPGIHALAVRTLGRGTRATWEAGWGDPTIAPTAIEVTYIDAAGPRSRQVQRLGLERLP